MLKIQNKLYIPALLCTYTLASFCLFIKQNTFPRSRFFSRFRSVFVCLLVISTWNTIILNNILQVHRFIWFMFFFPFFFSMRTSSEAQCNDYDEMNEIMKRKQIWTFLCCSFCCFIFFFSLIYRVVICMMDAYKTNPMNVCALQCSRKWATKTQSETI